MFDQIIERHGVEKIRTIGDNCMVAAGVPTRRPDHAVVLTKVALAMAAGLESLPARNGQRVQFRLGIHSGPMIAGVIGKLKFQYDLWGDAVNLAARMESHGVPGRVHVSKTTHALIEHAFDCEFRGAIPIKGKGEMETWFVRGPKNDAPALAVAE
jgi:class 3 adenylate cyclase